MCFLSTFYAIRRCAHFDLFTLAGNINNNQVELELQPHLVIQGVSYIVRKILKEMAFNLFSLAGNINNNQIELKL